MAGGCSTFSLLNGSFHATIFFCSPFKDAFIDAKSGFNASLIRFLGYYGSNLPLHIFFGITGDTHI